jgi:hypothetical protein
LFDKLPGSAKTEDEVDEVDEDICDEAPALNLPYKREFAILTDLSADSDSIINLDPQPVDVDRWELVISPAEYSTSLEMVSTFGEGGSASVQMRCPKFIQYRLTRILHLPYHQAD